LNFFVMESECLRSYQVKGTMTLAPSRVWRKCERVWTTTRTSFRTIERTRKRRLREGECSPSITWRYLMPLLTGFNFTERYTRMRRLALFAHLHYSDSVSRNSVVGIAISNLSGGRHFPTGGVLRCEGSFSHQA